MPGWFQKGWTVGIGFVRQFQAERDDWIGSRPGHWEQTGMICDQCSRVACPIRCRMGDWDSRMEAATITADPQDSLLAIAAGRSGPVKAIRIWADGLVGSGLSCRAIPCGAHYASVQGREGGKVEGQGLTGRRKEVPICGKHTTGGEVDDDPLQKERKRPQPR